MRAGSSATVLLAGSLRIPRQLAWLGPTCVFTKETCGLGLALDLTAQLQLWTPLSAVLICNRLPYFLAYVPSATLLLIYLRFHWCYRQLLQEQFFYTRDLRLGPMDLTVQFAALDPPLCSSYLQSHAVFSRICAFCNIASHPSALSLVLQATFYFRRFCFCSMVPFDLAGGCCTCFSLELFSRIHFCVTFP